MDPGLTPTVIARFRRLPEETRYALTGGLVVFLVALLFLFAARGDGAASGSYRVIARFNSVEGVSLDSPVRLAGVRIGRVAELSYDSDRQQAVATLAVRPDIEIPRDSLAIVTSEGMLGDRFIRIDPGGALDMMADGDLIEFTQDSIQFQELLAKVITTVERQRRTERDDGQGNDGKSPSGESGAPGGLLPELMPEGEAR